MVMVMVMERNESKQEKFEFKINFQ